MTSGWELASPFTGLTRSFLTSRATLLVFFLPTSPVYAPIVRLSGRKTARKRLCSGKWFFDVKPPRTHTARRRARLKVREGFDPLALTEVFRQSLAAAFRVRCKESGLLAFRACVLQPHCSKKGGAIVRKAQQRRLTKELSRLFLKNNARHEIKVEILRRM